MPNYQDWRSALDMAEPAQDGAEQLYQYYLGAGERMFGGPTAEPVWGRSPRDMSYLGALMSASADRERKPFNLPLRNAQHGLVGQVAANESPFGKYAGLFSVPTYNFAKFMAQRSSPLSGIPQMLDFVGDRLLDSGPNSMTQASPPSWEAIRWGLRPWWGRN